MNDQISEAWIEDLLAKAENHSTGITDLYIGIRDLGKLSNVTVHRYQCRRGCQIARVFRVSGLILCEVRDYKYSPGLNQRLSVASAREGNTLDGDRHWPSHVYDVEEVERFAVEPRSAGISMNCRHVHITIPSADILETVMNVRPGHPGKPTRL
jgi:hypothetical protein